MKITSLQFRLSLPLIVLVALMALFFTFVFYALNIELVGINEYEQKGRVLQGAAYEVYRMVQTGILVGEERYAVAAAQNSLVAQDRIQELAVRFPLESTQLETDYQRYYAALISINSLFLENRLTEARARLVELESHFDSMQNSISHVQERLASDRASSVRRINLLSLVFLSPIIVVLLVQFLVLKRALAPARQAVSELRLIEAGDLTRRLDVSTRDEIGNMAQSFNGVLEKVQAIITHIMRHSNTVASSATELSTVSTRSAQNVQIMSEKTSNVATASEQSSATTSSVAENMEQASSNLSSVASATEEMSATISEIASNTEKARIISTEAGEQAASMSGLMQQLEQAAQQIGHVTETITDISSQTNLLALNATIEAARAGAAGKGFAVVANEIKELARQTAAATEDIKSRIDGVQISTSGAIADIEKITEVINEVSHFVSSIAAAIEEQAVVTRDVASNIAQATAGVHDANRQVAQIASVSRSMAQDVAGVDAVSDEIREGGEQVQSMAAELSILAEQLKELVGQFRVGDGSTGVESIEDRPKELIVWGPHLSVGVLTMDDHHQKLIAIINDLYAALRQKRGLDVTKKLLRSLSQYVHYHFGEEEILLQAANYPKLDSQKKAHRFFLDNVENMEKRWLAGDKSVPSEMMSMLQKWLVSHIQNMDKQYEPFLNR